MPTRRIGDLPGSGPTTHACPDRDHDPEPNIVRPNGVYEHECPRCHATQRFVVAKPTLTAGPRARLG